MGKIKDMLTGLFSKKDEDDADEIIQIESVDEPDRDFMENENRYETPDYQSFLSDMGYIEKGEEKSIDDTTNAFASELENLNVSQTDETETTKDLSSELENADVFQTDEEETTVDISSELENLVATQKTDEDITATFVAKLADLETEQQKNETAPMDIDEKLVEKTTQASEIDFDQAFIDEGVAELGVNDVWPEEEN